MAGEHYDAIVIGTSQGGRFLPVELVRAGIATSSTTLLIASYAGTRTRSAL
jgi:pyruvate/2-oxoglutarate dehydrogenase complex dihydrolipoamide dehydrogenase (E3) component